MYRFSFLLFFSLNRASRSTIRNELSPAKPSTAAQVHGTGTGQPHTWGQVWLFSGFGFFSSPYFSLSHSQAVVHKPDNQVKTVVYFIFHLRGPPHPRLSPPSQSPSQAQHNDPVSLTPATDCASFGNHVSREGRPYLSQSSCTA